MCCLCLMEGTVRFSHVRWMDYLAANDLGVRRSGSARPPNYLSYLQSALIHRRENAPSGLEITVCRQLLA